MISLSRVDGCSIALPCSSGFREFLSHSFVVCSQAEVRESKMAEGAARGFLTLLAVVCMVAVATALEGPHVCTRQET